MILNALRKKRFCSKQPLDESILLLKLDYYKLFGLKYFVANPSLIKEKYTELAKIYHPDKKTGNSTVFKRINDAYMTLKDEKKRNEYNKRIKLQMKPSKYSSEHNNDDDDFKVEDKPYENLYEEDLKKIDMEHLFNRFYSNPKIKSNFSEIAVMTKPSEAKLSKRELGYKRILDKIQTQNSRSFKNHQFFERVLDEIPFLSKKENQYQDLSYNEIIQKKVEQKQNYKKTKLEQEAIQEKEEKEYAEGVARSMQNISKFLYIVLLSYLALFVISSCIIKYKRGFKFL